MIPVSLNNGTTDTPGRDGRKLWMGDGENMLERHGEERTL